MSIPPVWPLFRPFTHRFIKSNLTRSNQRYNYNNYNYIHHSKQAQSTINRGDHSPSYPPPLVTTTISVSSFKGVGTTVVPSESSSRVSDERTPHSFVQDKSWVEMREMREKQRSP